MKKKKIHIILIVLLGIFLMPASVFACGNHSEKSSCSKEMSSKTGMKDCCSKDSHSKSNKEKSCDGKCGQGLCSGNSSVNIGINVTEAFIIQETVFNFNTEKQKFYSSISFPSDGYADIWLIPKIG